MHYGVASFANNYWDINLTQQTNCHNDSNTGCDYTYNEESSYFGSTGIPFDETKLNWDRNWQANENGHPTLIPN